MPPKYVKTLRDELLYEYAKLMSRTVFKGKLNYGFVTDRFKALRDERITMSGTIREWQLEQELAKECVFCGALTELQMDHLIPRSRGGTDSSDNMVWACASCNASRGDRGVYVWLGLKKKDALHRLVAGKYLKQSYELHVTAGTLNVPVADIESLCVRCHNGDVCEKWETVGKLSCFCLESVF
jgi:hypothetical protein